MTYYQWGCSSAGRVPLLQGGSQGFESPQLHKHKEGSHRGLVRPPAKWLLREIGVVGSNPTPSAIFHG